jgi:hypothetical protein
MGHPHSEKLRVIERFHRVDFGHMEFQITFEDPETLVKPLTICLPVNYAADAEMLEWVCENERDAPHLPAASQGLKLNPETLAKYAGTYEFTGKRLQRSPGSQRLRSRLPTAGCSLVPFRSCRHRKPNLRVRSAAPLSSRWTLQAW